MGFMEYAIRMGSGPLIYVIAFPKDWFKHWEVIEARTHAHIHTRWRSHKPTAIHSK